MADVSALDKHFCPACGAEANWNPAKQALVCPYCGTTSPMELASDRSIIREHDLVTALRAIPEEKRGWDNARVAVQCKSCQAISLFDPDRVAQRCEFCGSPSIVPYEKTRSAIAPESLLPFRLPEPQVREAMRQWYGSRWFAPNRLKKAAMTDTVHGIYVPFWTFDARVHAKWTAEAGHYYYETVRRSGRTQRVRKVRWEPAAGELTKVFDDELVPATTGVHATLLRKVQAIPTHELVPYDPGYVSGWVVEQYHIDLVAAAEHARQSMDRQVREACADDVPGDTYRSLEVHATYLDQTFKHILVPLWLLSYTYGRQTYQVVVNGVTGETAGERPYSWIKILFAVIVALLLLALVSSLTER